MRQRYDKYVKLSVLIHKYGEYSKSLCISWCSLCVGHCSGARPFQQCRTRQLAVANRLHGVVCVCTRNRSSGDSRRCCQFR